LAQLDGGIAVLPSAVFAFQLLEAPGLVDRHAAIKFAPAGCRLGEGRLRPTGWALLLYLGMVPTALAFVVFLTGMEHTTATVVSIITLLEPLTATALAWLLFDEQLGVVGVLGAALLLGAIGLLYVGSMPRRQRSAREQTRPNRASL